MTLAALLIPEHPARHPSWTFVTLFGLAQISAALLSFSTQLEPGSLPILWATHGILLTALLCQPVRWWSWSILLSVFAEIGVGCVLHPAFAVDSLSSACVHALSIPFVAWMLRRPGFEPIRSLQISTFMYLLTWLGLGSLAAALLTSWEPGLLTSEQAWRVILVQRISPEMLGVMLVTPLLMAMLQGRSSLAKREYYYLELGLFLGLVAVLALLLVFKPRGTDWPLFGRPYLVLPVFLWGGLRLSLAAVSLGQLVVAGITIATTCVGLGPFWGFQASHVPASVVLQIFLLTLSVCALTLVVVKQEHTEQQGRLRQALSRLENALAGAVAGAWDFNIRTQETIYSSAWKRQLDYDPHDISDTYETFLSLLHPDDREGFLQYHNRYVEQRPPDPYQIEFRLQARGGSYRWFSSRAHLMADERGQREWLCGIHVDITERKTLEGKIRDRLRFEALISALGRQFLVANVADWEKTLRHAIDEVANYLQADRLGLLQFSEETHSCVFHHEFQAKGIDTKRPHPLANGPELSTESTFPWFAERTRSGEPVIFERLGDLPAKAEKVREALAHRPVKSMAQIPLISSGRILGVLYVDAVRSERAWDLDTLDRFGLLSHLLSVAIERHRFEQELSVRAEVERTVSVLSSRFANCPNEQVENEVEFALETMGRLAGVDRCCYFEFSSDLEWVSKRFEWCAEGIPTIKHLEQNIPRKSFENAFQRVLNGDTLYYQSLGQFDDTQNGHSPRWPVMPFKSAVYVPLFVAGTPIGAIGQATIGEHKTWSKERIIMLKLVGEMLTGALERRRSALALEENRKQLTAASRLAVMGEMVAGIAHEIRQPLHAMRNFAAASIHAMNGTETPPLGEVRRWNERIMSLVDRSDEIIRRYRDFCRPQKSEFRPLRIDDILGEAVQMLQGDLRNGKIQFDAALPSHLPCLVGDRIQLEQVLVNVLKNACDAMASVPSEQRRIKVRAERGRVSSGLVTLQIRDYGQGLAPDAATRAFEPFWTSKPQGTGLGLAVCRTIIKDHGGRIWLESAAPGIQVNIELPVEEAKAT